MENVIALAIVGIVVIGILSALAVAIVGTDKAYDRHILLEVAQSQLEDIQRQTYQTLASGYTLITAPDGYAIAVAVATPVAYTYPNASAPQQVLQQVTVTVTGVQGNLELVGYRRRE